MTEFHTDILFQIFIRLDATDLIRCKGVCKSWRSLISNQRFINSHVNYSYNNDHKSGIIPHTRIVMSKYECEYKSRKHDFLSNHFKLLGSSNGLICIHLSGDILMVVNLFTREMRKLPEPVFIDNIIDLCWGFGYDCITDDYKVVVLGYSESANLTCFKVLSLRSNVWKVVGNVKNYTALTSISFGTFRNCPLTYTSIGTFCNGALHWFMVDENKKKVILSFDLSLERCKEIPQPDDPRYIYSYNKRLTIVQDSLCIYNFITPACDNWIMKNYNVKQSWELVSCVLKRDKNAPRYLKDRLPHLRSCGNVSLWFSLTSDDIRAPIFVPSLVSPHVRGGCKRKR